MSTRTKVMGVGALMAAFALGGGTWAIAGGGNGSVTGPEADRAKTAALAHTGGGTANAVERDGENGATWEVEVTKPNGETVDVRLDEGYKVVAEDSDDETADDNGSDAGEQGEDESGG